MSAPSIAVAQSAQQFPGSAERISQITGEFLWEVDAGGRYTYVSSAASELTGYEPSELLGKHYAELIEESSREKVRAEARAIFRSRGEIRSLLNVIVRKDGRRVTVLTNGRPLLAPDGTLLGYCGSDRDVTDLCRLMGECQHFRRVVADANFGIAIADANSVLTYANEAFARDHGYEPGEIIGHPIAVLHSPSHMSEVERLIGIIHSEGSFQGEEVWHRRKDGSEFPMLMTGILLTGPDGSQSIAATALDITGRKRVESELLMAKEKAEQSDRTKSVFLSVISHEFRTPLNHILGFSSLIEHSVSDPEVAGYSTIIKKSADEFLQMVDDLIELSNTEIGLIRARKKAFRLSALIRGAEHSLEELLDDSGKAGSIRIVPFDPALICTDLRVGDAPRLRLLLGPLLKNAVKFTSSGSIAISCDEPAPGRVRFLIKDSGQGIPSEKAGEIFEPFMQADSGSTRAFGGIGIGLAVSRNIATVLGGQVRLTSTGPAGTTVEVIVPLAPSTGPEVKTPPDACAGHPKPDSVVTH